MHAPPKLVRRPKPANGAAAESIELDDSDLEEDAATDDASLELGDDDLEFDIASLEEGSSSDDSDEVIDEFGIVGTTVGNFRVIEPVAEGGFAIIYRAEHLSFRAQVALKCLRIPDWLSPKEHQTFVEKFRGEGELMFRLSAEIPEIVRPIQLDVKTLPNGVVMPFLAMEWLEAESLDAYVDRRLSEGKPKLNVHEVMELLHPIARALQRAHSFQYEGETVAVIHRDIKPDNILVMKRHSENRDEMSDKNDDDQPTVKILDFGIARARFARQLRAGAQTQERAISFTPGYAAPEQWLPRRHGQTGPWTDVWGLALTMVDALIGGPPFEGTPEEKLDATLDEKTRPTPRTLGVEVHESVDDVFRRALAIDPPSRIQSVKAFWDELARALATSSIVHDRVPFVQAFTESGQTASAELAAPEASNLELAFEGPVSTRQTRHTGNITPARPIERVEKRADVVQRHAPSPVSEPPSPRDSQLDGERRGTKIGTWSLVGAMTVLALVIAVAAPDVGDVNVKLWVAGPVALAALLITVWKIA